MAQEEDDALSVQGPLKIGLIKVCTAVDLKKVYCSVSQHEERGGGTPKVGICPDSRNLERGLFS